jgi:hypothetical protein
MATQEETAAVREAFDKLGDILLRPETIGLMKNTGGTTRGRLVYTLHSMITDAHQLAAVILDMDRADTDEATGGPARW